MSPAPLAPAQKSALDLLVHQGKLRIVPPDAAKAARFLASAQECMNDVASGSLSPRSIHRLCYDVAHDVAEAILAAYGYRTTPGQGQHQALAETVVAVIDHPPAAAAAAASFDALRQQRNAGNYQAGPITEAAASRAHVVATSLLAEAQRRL